MKMLRIPSLLILILFSTIAQAQTAEMKAINDDLIAAARKSNVEAVKSLLAKGADVNAKTEYGATPLFFACDRGNAEIVKILLDHGAQINVQDTFYKSTPLIWAVQRDHAEVVKLLVEKNPQSKEMVMNMAVGQSQARIVKAMLETGGFKDEAMSNYLAIAERNKNAEIIAMLKAAGAKPKVRLEYKVDAETLKIYEGVFKNEQVELNFKVKDGVLFGMQGGQEFKMNPVEKHAFEPDGVPGVTGIFNLESEKVISVTIKQGGGEMILKKQ